MAQVSFDRAGGNVVGQVRQTGSRSAGAERRSRDHQGVSPAAAQSRYQVEALAKGLRILALFSEARPALRLNDIAERSGIPVTTAFRLVNTLEAEGYLERLPDGWLRPSTAVLELGFASLRGLDLVQTAALLLRRLSDSSGQTVNLSVLRGDRVLYLTRIRGTELVTASLQVGSVLPAVHSSMGKLLLAYLSPQELQDRLGPESFAGSWGPNAVTSLTALRRRLNPIRKQGWAIQDEEVAHGLRSIAGPVCDADGRVVASVNIAVQAAPWPVERIVTELRQPLLDTCDEVSRRFGSPEALTHQNGYHERKP